MKKVLIIDDDKTILKIIQMQLNDLGMEIITENDPKEALNIVKKETLSAIICDINMPGLGGLDVLSMVRAEAWDIPFVIISGQYNEDIMLQALRLGAMDFLQKPVDQEHIKNIVSRISEVGKRRVQIRRDLEKIKLSDDIEERESLHKIIIENLKKSHLIEIYNNISQLD